MKVNLEAAANVPGISANFPKDGSGYLLAVQFSGDDSGRTVPRMLSSVQTEGLRSTLQALVATID